ncbi:MAG: bifunctional folylpolyglutamate synthase/dihydrofolate synthase [Candidatus Thermoplasmatota archaeon]|nr:bifunctional folylpolyglutamate synthase/dihydrofolate synthase [Candidatus Thermoplasmatota archaeon]
MCSTLKDTNPLSYSDAFTWLSSFDRYGWIFGLERISYLLEKLGNPHRQLQVIHVAGTNGKGSVCQYIGSILKNAGFTVGVYLSPHVERFSERIVVGNQEISKEDLAMCITQVKPVVEQMRQQDNTPTFFEIVTALAFLHFKNRKVDYAVVEVGLGGRFDATNVVCPVVSVITNISLEHTEILGKDLCAIASEKAGIIKEHVPVVTAATQDALTTIEQVALERHAPVIRIDRFTWKRTSFPGRYQEFLIHGSFQDYRVKTSLLGTHQGENIALAITAVEQLQMNGVFVTDANITDGISAATHPARMEIVSEHPLILLDGAHNPAGIMMLARTIKEDFPSHRLILVLGMLRDKDIGTMIATIVPLADVVIVTQSTNPRAADPQLLKELIMGFDEKKIVSVSQSINEAIDHAWRLAREKDLICVTGSLFTVGEIRSYLLRGKNRSETSPS